VKIRRITVYLLKTVDLCRDFKTGAMTVHALRNVNIEIEKGKLTILMGRSGSGKTTLINLLGALDTPTSGKVFFNDIEISKLSASKRDQLRREKIGLVFQSIALISTMSAYENLDFSLRISGISARERKRLAEESLELVGLGRRMKHRPHELSGGEQQRVAIARAVAHRPELVLADEPTGELDTQTSLRVVSLFKNLIEKQGVTVLMTTHDPDMVEVADHVYILEDGEIVDEKHN